DAADALFVTKSVIHNRPYRPPLDSSAAAGRRSTSTAVCVAPDGTLIENRDLEQNLVELFTRWRGLLARHGLVVIEAHTTTPAIAALHRRRSLVTALDAAHAYSHQLLVEPEVFRSAFA